MYVFLKTKEQYVFNFFKDPIKDEPKETKLIVTLIGSINEDFCSQQDIYNIRDFLSMLIELLIKNNCWLIVPEGNNLTLLRLIESILDSNTSEHRKAVITDLPKQQGINNYNAHFLDEKSRANLTTQECVILCNGSILSKRDIASLKENAVVVLKASGGLADIIAELQQTT
uniref:Uncharacterized protein n=1 Tax=Biomphalaria glabrata TaxID=6526 RepID=A0A2C9KXV9_BIOGL